MNQQATKSTLKMLKANTALEWLMRAGYGARGVVYLLIGAIALFAAINGGEAEGSTGALEYLAGQPFGKVMLGVVAAGLFAYTLWRLIDGIMDLECEGDDAEGYASRAGQIMSGLTHAALGVSALLIIFSSASTSGGGDTTTEAVTGYALGNSGGRLLILVVGAVTFAVGVYLFVKAFRALYRKDIRHTQTTEFLAPAVRFGLYAHGFVLLIIGGLIFWAAISNNAETAAGLGETLRILETQTFGRTILGITGAGLMGFSVYCFVMARYRILPRFTESDIRTLANL